jgi:negative regulator of sigma-B (phosphoserine phosphatase)
MVPPVSPQLSDDWPDALEVGLAGMPIEGERRSGDLAVFAAYDGGALVAVIDGLGHGISAYDAAQRAAEVLREHPSEPAQSLLERCHKALRHTRGAVMTLAWFDLAAERLEWTGVGNVEARLLRAADGVGAREASPVVLGGVIGFQLPKAIRTSTMELQTGDAVAFATDGVGADFSAVLDPAVPVQAQAERMLSEHGKGTDDALAVVVRWRR